MVALRKGAVMGRTIAFYFAQGGAATETLDSLRSHGVDGSPSTAPVVIDGDEGIILAVSVDARAQAEVERLARAHGGVMVADIPDSWVRPAP
jgi:hypothetical protein